MITDKQKQRDYEYNGDYQSKSKYTAAQWTNILNSGQIADEDLEILKEVYRSFNHVATLLQLSSHLNMKKEDILSRLNGIGETLGKANDLKADTDFSGNEYWWYLCFWGKENKEAGGLELKMQPELTEAIAGIYPEMEEAYYALANSVERSLQIRYSPEDSVWIASAVLLYEKYYCNPGITADEILLMQYEIQTRAQKIYGQDVNFNTITQTCNADARTHHFNYLRDIYKYYRVTFPGECDDELERPDPENTNYDAYVYTIFGYMTLNQIYDFVAHEYTFLVDESYVELTQANGFVRMAAFLTRQGGKAFDKKDSSEQGIQIRADGADAEATFHQISEALLQEYPNFSYALKSSWYQEESGMTASVLWDVMQIERYAYTGASIAVSTFTEGDAVHIEISLNLPVVDDEDCMRNIMDKCSMLPLMTTAEFRVEETAAQPFDAAVSPRKIKASVLYPYSEFPSMKEADIIGNMGTALQVFASYYTEICQNFYPPEQMSLQESFAAALGDKFKARPSNHVAGPNIIYKQGAGSPTADYIVNVLQNTIGGQNEGGVPQTPDIEEEEFTTEGTHIGKKINLLDEEEGVVKKVTDTSKLVIPKDPAPSNMASASQNNNFAAHASNTGFVSVRGGNARTPVAGTSSNANASAPSDAVNPSNIAAGSGTSQLQTAIPGSAQPQTAGAPTSANGQAPAQPATIAHVLPNAAMPMYMAPSRPKVAKSEHADRRDQSFRMYPKNTLIQGPVKTGKYHEAMTTAVGIIEGKDSNMMSIEPVPDILEHYRDYVAEGRILHISYPDINQDGYDGWIESSGPVIQDGIFKTFANGCKDGRYVVMMEDVDLNWMHLFGETSVLLRDNRREGTSSETTVTLLHSGETFQLPSNLYIVATCDSIVCEDTILGAISQDFFIRHIAADSSILRGMRVEGILLERLMSTLNLRISYFLGHQYQLGEGFFLGSADKDPFISLSRVFREQLIPILETWFDGDMERMRYVLGDNAKTRPDTIFFREIPYRKGLFKGSLPDDFDTERRIYEINESAFMNPKSYIDIYE